MVWSDTQAVTLVPCVRYADMLKDNDLSLVTIVGFDGRPFRKFLVKGYKPEGAAGAIKMLNIIEHEAGEPLFNPDRFSVVSEPIEWMSVAGIGPFVEI